MSAHDDSRLILGTVRRHCQCGSSRVINHIGAAQRSGAAGSNEVWHVALTVAADYNAALFIREGTRVMSLPLSFRKEGTIERHQIEGTDPSDRYFNRSIQVNRSQQGYTGSVMYEALTVTGQTRPTIGAAVAGVVEKLQQLGFTRLRTRPNFKGQRYLAEKETWVDYPDK